MSLTSAKKFVGDYAFSAYEKMPLTRTVQVGGKLYCATIDMKTFAMRHEAEIAKAYMRERCAHLRNKWYTPRDDMRIAFAKVFDSKAVSYDKQILATIRAQFNKE